MKFTSPFVISFLLASTSAVKLQEDPPAVVSPEAEKVSVLQTVINPTRTTFYDKKHSLWREIIAQVSDDHVTAQVTDDNVVVSPEAEKVSVLQTVINPTRTTFYNKKQP